MSQMPIMPVNAMVAGCTEDEARIVLAAFTSRGVQGPDMRLKANKPFKKVTTFEQGCANYVWRMLCFDCVGWGKHACMPVCVDFELCDAFSARDGQAKYSERREDIRNLMAELDLLVKKVEANLPLERKAGLLRWGRALGYL